MPIEASGSWRQGACDLSTMELDVSSNSTKKLTSPWLWVLISVLIIIPIVVAAILYYKRDLKQLKQEKYDEIAAVARLKDVAIEHWLDAQFSDAATFSGRGAIIRYLNKPHDEVSRRRLREQLSLEESVAGYNELFLVNGDGKIILSTRGNRSGLFPSEMPALNETLSRRGPVLTDLFKGDDGQIYLDVLEPVLGQRKETRAVLVLRSDANAFLYPLLSSWPVPSRSAESALVERNGNYARILSKSRFKSDTELRLKFPLTDMRMPAVQAALGRRGMTEGFDYRGGKVLAYIVPVSGTPWLLLTKIDAKEVFAEVSYRGRVIAVFVILFVILTAAVMAFLHRHRQANVYRELYEAQSEANISAQSLAAIVNSSNEGIIGKSLDGTVISWNQGAERIYGYKAGEMIGQSISRLVPPGHDDDLPSILESITTGREVREYETIRRRKDGTLINVSISVSPVHDDRGRVVSASVIARDITERKLEENLKAARLHLLDTSETHGLDDILGQTLDEAEKLTGSLLSFFIVIDEDLDTISMRSWSTRTRELHCVKDEEFSHSSISAAGIWADCIRERRPIMHNDFHALKKRKGLPEGHADIVRELLIPIFRGEKIRAVLCVANKPVPYDESDVSIVTRLADSAWDISERKWSEERLKASEEKYRQIVEASNEGILSLDEDRRLIFVNRQFASMLGYSPEELLGKNYESLMPDDQLAEERKQAAIRAQGVDAVYERCFLTKNGERRWTIVSAKAVADSSGNPNGAFGMFTDITSRKIAEKALQESEEKFRALVEDSPIGIAIHNGRGFLYVNPTAIRETGYSPEELGIMGVTEIVHPEDRPLLTERIRRRLNGDNVQRDVELRVLSRDGKVIWTEMSASPINYEGHSAVLITARDIREKKKLEEQLLQAQKMEGIGRLAGGVAHDFNNLLGVLIGYTQLMMRKLKTADPMYHYAQQMDSAAKRGADLTRQLLTFARKEIASPQPLSPNDAIKSLQKMLGKLLGENVDVKFEPAASAWNIKIDPTQFDQLLVNLATNSRDAMDGAGRIDIETSNLCVDDEYAERNADMQPGDYFMITFSDNGRGMNRETLERIFEPFFTTKPRGEGTGLGLSTVYGIVKQNGGTISVYSEEGRGTTFKMYFPRYYGEVDDADKHDDISNGSGTETVLVVEDQRELLDLSRNILEEFGYKVLAAATPEEAILWCMARKERVHVLLTDVIMPGMNGKELSEKVRELIPDIRTVFMSGYTANVIAESGVVDESIEFIQKPFTPHELARKIREVLDS